jgi:hypothetical protein
MLLASQIYNRISLIDSNFDKEKDVVINTFGRVSFSPLAYKVPWSGSMGASFFDWDGGSTARISAYMRLLGYKVTQLPKNEKLKYIHYFKDMPAWPSSGSIKKVEDVYLIKLGEEPDPVHLKLINESNSSR